MLGLGMLGLYDFGSGGWRWVAVDVLWAIAGGLAIGGALGALVGKLVVYLRTQHKEAVGLDEFLALGLIAIAYGVARLSVASGFLAVFAAGLALQRIQAQSKKGQPSTGGEGQDDPGRREREGSRDSRGASRART
jgi:NhaP-type Na+/H+ or K+/H+ antiporter